MVALLSVAIAITIWELGRDLRISYKRLEDYALDLEQKVCDRTIELQQANWELSRLAHVDGLTQIANRRSFVFQAFPVLFRQNLVNLLI